MNFGELIVNFGRFCDSSGEIPVNFGENCEHFGEKQDLTEFRRPPKPLPQKNYPSITPLKTKP